MNLLQMARLARGLNSQSCKYFGEKQYYSVYLFISKRAKKVKPWHCTLSEVKI